MADPRFYLVAGPFSLGQLAEISNAELDNKSAAEQLIYDVAPLSTAESNQISFWDNKRYLEEFNNSKAGACIVRPEVESNSDEMVLLKTSDPYTGYAKIAQAFYPNSIEKGSVADSAFIDQTAILDKTCQVDAGAVIGAQTKIGKRTRIGANSVVSDGVEIGSDCRIGPNVTLQSCLIGDGVVLHAGVRIGQDGFGFAMSEKGHLKVPQLGRVIIENDVEIGANSTVDRGAGPDTVIGQGSKIDNLVQIAHNVKIGRNCIIVSQVGISGSTKVGDFVVMGGQAGLTGHLSIGDGVQIAAQSGVMRNIEAGQQVGGTPSVPMRQWLKSVALMEKLLKSNKKF